MVVYPQDDEAIEAWSSTANDQSRIQSRLPLSTSYPPQPSAHYSFPASDPPVNAESSFENIPSGRSSPGLPALTQGTTHSRSSSIRRLSFSPTTRRFANSVRSMHSFGSAASGNSDPKSLCEDLQDYFETSKTEMHWNRGASILRHLNEALVRFSPTSLRTAMKSLSSAAKEANLNAKAWSTIRKILRTHVKDLEGHLGSLDIHMEAYIKILKEVLAFWIYSVDTSIRHTHEELPPSEGPSQFSQSRHELCLLTQQYDLSLTDEDFIYEQKNRLKEAFQTMIGKASRGRVGSSPANSDTAAKLELANDKRRKQRETHAGVKRQRDNINEKIQELALLLPEEWLDTIALPRGRSDGGIRQDPSFSGVPSGTVNGSVLSTGGASASDDDLKEIRVNKGAVLQSSVEYIKDLVQVIQMQRVRNQRLESELAQYENRFGGASMNPT